jgi:DNA repair exonuclease SbcCD ATPase subunit
MARLSLIAEIVRDGGKGLDDLTAACLEYARVKRESDESTAKLEALKAEHEERDRRFRQEVFDWTAKTSADDDRRRKADEAIRRGEQLNAERSAELDSREAAVMQSEREAASARKAALAHFGVAAE